MVYIGIDNGVSGTIGIISDAGVNFIETPIKNHLKYTKKKSFIKRIDHLQLKKILVDLSIKSMPIKVMLERPMVNPRRFTATSSAIRALEATLIVLEQLNIPYEFIDSKEWQKSLLPKGLKGSNELKEASKLKGIQLYPQFSELINKHGDADGLLIAHYIKHKK